MSSSGRLIGAAITPSGITGEALGQHFTSGGEFRPDEPKAEQPAAHGVFLVVAGQRGRFAAPGVFRVVAQRQAELDKGFHPTSVEAPPSAFHGDD